MNPGRIVGWLSGLGGVGEGVLLLSALRMGGAGSEFEGAPGIVKAVGVGEANVAAGRSELGVPGLHPHDLLSDAGLGGDGEATHAAADARVTKSLSRTQRFNAPSLMLA